LLHFAALGPWLYLDIFRRETEQTFFTQAVALPRSRLAGPAQVRWLRALPRFRKWRWHGSGAARLLSRARASLPTKAAPPMKLRFESSLRTPDLD
jgi:hypothetical protein